MSTLAQLGFVIDSSGAKRGATEGVRAIDSLGDAAKRAKSSIAEAAKWLGIAGIGAGIAEAVKGARDFERDMALVETIADKATYSTLVFSDQLRELARSMPVQSLADLTAGLQNIIGAGIPAGEAMDFLATAAKAATANNATTADAVKALTSVVNAYASQGLKARDVSDQLFAAIDVGDVSMQEFAETLGRITPIASSMNVPLADVLASISALTVGGIKANEAVTGIRSAMVNIIKPTGDFAQKFPELAKEFNATKLQADGFVKFLTDFRAATGGASEAVTSLFTDVQGLTAVNALLSDGGDRVTTMLGEVGDATGSTQKAFDIMMATSSSLAQVVRNQLIDMMLALGTRVLPLVNGAMRGFSNLLEWVRTNGPAVAGAITAAATALAIYHGAARVAAGWTAVLGAAQTIQAFLSLARTVRTAADAMALLSIVSGGPAKAVVALAAMTAGFVAYKAVASKLTDETKKFNAELERIQDNQGGVNDALANMPKIDLPPDRPTNAGTVDQDALDRARALRQENAERVRLAQQAYALAGLENDEAARLRIEQDAENELRRVAAELSGEQLEAARRSIELAKEWNLAALAGNEIAERRRQLTDSRARIDGVAAETTALREQIAALSESGAAYERVVVRQREDAAVLAERNRLKAAGLTLSAEEEARLRAAVRENERLAKVLDAMQGVDGNPLVIPDDALDRVGKVADSIAQAVSAAQGLASAFGEVGRSVGAVLGQTAQLLTNLSRAQQAGITTDADGNKRDVGFTGALSGAAGAAGVAASVTSALGMIGAVVAIGDAFDLFGTKARERARQMREAAIEFNRALDDFALAAGTSLEDALEDNIERAREVAKKGMEAFGLEGTLPDFRSASDITAWIVEFEAALAKWSPKDQQTQAFRDFLDAMREVGETAAENERILRERNAAELSAETANAQVRLLRSQGLDAEADALQAQLDLDRAIAEAREKYGEAGNDYIALLEQIAANEAALAEERRAAQAAADAAREAEEALRRDREGRAFDADLGAREAALAGNDRDAFIIAAQARAQAELDAASDLLNAGTITAEAFMRLVNVLNGELAEAIADYDAALAEEARRKQDAADAEAAASAAREASQLASITTRTADALRRLNPEMAAKLDADQLAAERAAELAEAESDVVRARLAELYALEDQAAALDKATASMEAAAEAASDLADFAGDINEQWLRETGRDFDADKLAIEKWFQEAMKEAIALGASPETIAQIREIYESKLGKLIEDTIENAGPINVGDTADASQDFLTRGVARAVSGAEALQLLDVQLEQLNVLRVIASNTGQLVRDGIGAAVPNAPTRAPLPDDGEAVAARVETNLGRRVGIERRLTGSNVL